MPRRRRIICLALIVVVFFLILINNYFLSILSRTENEVRTKELTIQEKILQKVPIVNENYKGNLKANDSITETFLRNLKINKKLRNFKKLWSEAKSWVSKTQLYDPASPELGNVLQSLKTAKIMKADVDTRGTQFKLLLTLEGGQQAIFKPKWYPIDRIIEGPVYAGKDRYSSEILAFYLSAILKRPLTAPATDRKISLEYDIAPVSSPALLETIFEHNSINCVYGKCFYCKREDPVCEDVDKKLNGAIILNIDADFKINRSPWQRTYKKNRKAQWENDNNYCRKIRNKITTQRLLDLIDTAIFDFLIQNGDRHHYETLNNAVIWIDNGKGLGNPNVHHLDILAPLYQCCMIKSETWHRLEYLSGGVLKEKLEAMPNIHNIITEAHLKAIEHRLVLVLATVEYCRTRNKMKHNLFK